MHDFYPTLYQLRLNMGKATYVRFVLETESLSFAVVVLIASIPLAIEIVTTTTLALGSKVLSVRFSFPSLLSMGAS